MNVTTQPILMTSVADGLLRQYDYPDNSEIVVSYEKHLFYYAA